jgi:hypothetical protein
VVETGVEVRRRSKRQKRRVRTVRQNILPPCFCEARDEERLHALMSLHVLG